MISLAPRGNPTPAPPPPQRGLVSNMRVVSLLTMVSRVFGLLRDTGMAAAFGNSTILDAFIVAFRVPNLARQLFGEGALSTAFMPVFLEARQQRGDQSARETFSAIAVALGVFLSVIVLVLEAGLGILLVTIQFSESTTLLMCLLMWLLPYMVVICLAALSCAALHAQREFFWPAVVPILLNFFWLLALAGTHVMWLTDRSRALTLAACVLGAGCLQLALPLLVLQRRGMGLIQTWQRGWPAVGQVIRTIIPVVIGMAVVQVSAVLDSLLAWSLSIPDDGSHAVCEWIGITPFLPAGTVSALFLGQRLYQFPLGVFGVALGTVLFPVLTQHAQAGDLPALRNDLLKGLRIVIAIALPASVGLVVLAHPIARAFFQHGRFDAGDAALTGRMIAVYGAGTWSFISLAILNRAFYATGDRRTPMRLGLLALCVNLTLNVLLVRQWQGPALAAGSVLACTLQVALAWRLLSRRVQGLPGSALLPTLWKAAVASTLMGLVCLWTASYFADPRGPIEKLIALGAPLAAGGVVYAALARLLGIHEVRELLSRE